MERVESVVELGTCATSKRVPSTLAMSSNIVHQEKVLLHGPRPSSQVHLLHTLWRDASMELHRLLFQDPVTVLLSATTVGKARWVGCRRRQKITGEVGWDGLMLLGAASGVYIETWWDAAALRLAYALQSLKWWLLIKVTLSLPRRFVCVFCFPGGDKVRSLAWERRWQLFGSTFSHHNSFR